MEFFLAFAFGLIAGSFLNVVIYRLKTRQNIVFGGSFCPECKTKLKWHDLAPILSFVWLKGRCRYCDKKISLQYPVVEILSGLIWLGVFWKSCFYVNFSPYGRCPEGTQFLNSLNLLDLLNFFYYILIFSAFLIIAVYDFKWRIIPDKIVYPAITAAFIFNLFNAFKLFLPTGDVPKGQNFETLKYLNIEIFIWSLFAALIAFSFFFLIYFFSRGKAMGLGDAKLAFLIGLFLGPALTIAALTTTFTIGAVFGIILIVASKIPNPWFHQKWVMKSQIAFGPLLVFGAAIVFFFSNFVYKFLNF